MYSVVLMALGTIGFLYWHGYWIRSLSNDKKLSNKDAAIALVGVISLLITVMAFVPLLASMMTNTHAIDVGKQITFVIMPLAGVYSIAGVIAVVKGWKAFLGGSTNGG